MAPLAPVTPTTTFCFFMYTANVKKNKAATGKFRLSYSGFASVFF